MPLTLLTKEVGFLGVVRQSDVIWVEALHNMTMADRTEWVGNQIQRPAVGYHLHGIAHNELRCAFRYSDILFLSIWFDSKKYHKPWKCLSILFIFWKIFPR